MVFSICKSLVVLLLAITIICHFFLKFSVLEYSVSEHINNNQILHLMRSYNCISCHDTSRYLVGPSYIKIAKKYKNNFKAEKYLVNKIKHGGAGIWGIIPMPSYPELSDNDSHKLIKWILQQKISSK